MKIKIFLLFCVLVASQFALANDKNCLVINIDSISVNHDCTSLNLFITLTNNGSDVVKYDPDPTLPFSTFGWGINIYKSDILLEWNVTYLPNSRPYFHYLAPQSTSSEIFACQINDLVIDEDDLNGIFETEIAFIWNVNNKKSPYEAKSNRMQFEINNK